MVSNPIICCSVTHWISTMRGIKCPQHKKTAGAFRPLERGYLGKETVQNMLVFRFANPGFEPIWNHHYIDHVQITAAEDEDIGTRAGYYDTTGVVRDMVQNHLLQLLCMTAMEPPVSYDGVSLRNETVKVLQAIRPIDIQRDCVLGQYGAGELDSHEIRAYRDEENVLLDSATPTFAALKLTLDNWRWARVPF